MGVVKFLIGKGANIHLKNNDGGRLDIHANNGRALKLVLENGNLGVVNFPEFGLVCQKQHFAFMSLFSKIYLCRHRNVIVVVRTERMIENWHCLMCYHEIKVHRQTP